MSMAAATEKSPLESYVHILKARAAAKQQRLERALAEPVTQPREQDRRTRWIKRALTVVKRSQEEIKQEAALLDAYAAHLSVLEMNLLAAAEQRATGQEKGKKVQ
jgi:hypothetical protein